MTVSSFSGVMGVQLLVFLFMLALDVCALRTGLHEGAHPTLDDRDPAIIATNNAIIGADATLRLEMGRSNVLLSAASHGQDIVINVSGIDFSLQHQKIQDDNNLEATAGYISLFFERNDDRAAPGEVTLAVGKDIPRLDTVLAMPHIPALLSPSNGQESSQNFLSIAMKTSIVAHTMDHPIDLKGPIALSLASPYSLVPANVAHAIYSDIGGAELVNGLWSLPCDTRIGTSVIIGGEMYPIHPWDTVILSSPLTEGQCAGPFQPLQDEHDGVTLGWSFVRNVYMLAHAGDNITGEGPYIQLLSVSNETEEGVSVKSDLSKAAAHPAIIVQEIRRDDDDSDDDDDHSNESSDDNSEHDGDSEHHDDDKDNTPVLIGIAVAAGVMVIVAIALIIWIRRRKFWREHQRYRKRASNVTSYAELGMHADGHHSVMSLRPNAAAAQDAHSGMGVGHARNPSSDSLMSEHPSRPPSASSMNNFRTFGHHNKSSLSIVEYPPAAYSRMPVSSRSPSPEMVGTHKRGSSSQDIRATGHQID